MTPSGSSHQHANGGYDLHTHSACSDGTESPADVVRAAAAADLSGIALTDHDTLDGLADARAAAADLGVHLLHGVEMSCQNGFLSVHMLSYLHRPDDVPLTAEFTKARESRLTRARRMVESIATEYPITWEDVSRHVQPGATVGRPHIADALVAAGYIPNRSAAFESVLSSHSRHYMPYYAPDPTLAVALIREAGGVPVLAHGLASARGRVLTVPQIHDLVDAGLAGVEIYHRDHDADAVEKLERIAADRRLLVTGSSDYHGTGKPNAIGENRTPAHVVDQLEEMADGSVQR